MTEAYPLQWPDHQPRTQWPERSRFNVSLAVARDALLGELHLMKATLVVLSSNVKLRQDGLPYGGQREPYDPGVAVYFQRKDQSMVFACDRWDVVRDNIQAIRHTIGALRGIDRWGTGDMMEAAFTGFVALPAPDWRGCLGLDASATLADAERAYRSRARAAHPDAGGSHDDMARLNGAILRAREALCQ